MTHYLEMDWGKTLGLEDENEALEEFLYSARFTPVVPEHITDQDRWHTYFEAVVYDTKLECHWRVNWTRGSTEYQDCEPNLEVHKVEPHEVTVTEYRLVVSE